jgi:hypothetical protein
VDGVLVYFLYAGFFIMSLLGLRRIHILGLFLRELTALFHTYYFSDTFSKKVQSGSMLPRPFQLVGGEVRQQNCVKRFLNAGIVNVASFYWVYYISNYRSFRNCYFKDEL